MSVFINQDNIIDNIRAKLSLFLDYLQSIIVGLYIFMSGENNIPNEFLLFRSDIIKKAHEFYSAISLEIFKEET